jgi:hypothetical protein
MGQPVLNERRALLKEVKRKEIDEHSEIIQYFYEHGIIVSVGIVDGEIKYRVTQKARD